MRRARMQAAIVDFVGCAFQAAERKFVNIGGRLYEVRNREQCSLCPRCDRRGASEDVVGCSLQAGMVPRQKPFEHFVEVAGQPVFLSYQPDSLIRGQPADSLVWVAYDEFGSASASATISVNIMCSPGYVIDSAAPEDCLPCGPGSYNIPEASDQVGVGGKAVVDR